MNCGFTLGFENLGGHSGELVFLEDEVPQGGVVGEERVIRAVTCRFLVRRSVTQGGTDQGHSQNYGLRERKKLE